MRLQVPLLVEGFAAVFKGTHKVSLALMLLQVHLEALLPTVGLVAALDRAHKVLGLLMRLHVVPQVTLGHERLLASREIALERPEVLELFTQKQYTTHSSDLLICHRPFRSDYLIFCCNLVAAQKLDQFELTWIFWCSKSGLR